MDTQKDGYETTEKGLGSLLEARFMSRRDFLKLSGISVIALTALNPFIARGGAGPLIIMEQAKGLVISEPTRCVGCRRCELACTEYNDGKAKPSIARIKVGRNMNFGPKGLYASQNGQGNWGNGLIIQDLCKQCPHPVPCADACPNDAIVVSPPTNARVVDKEKCIGCKMCQKACPWEMMVFDSDNNKATKCFLCKGSPKCVEACPAGALSYVNWVDLTREVPPRIAQVVVTSPEKGSSCNTCHKKR
ncbi:MAG: 4Fe-4S dicluster domain-containing protein [Syntrophorhabdaceae bacterium]|nr:4Fe-4S dicluster domain-containing protein [Syntrophorhabdaceae bacterium]